MLRYLHPRWLLLHVFVLASCYGMIYAGGWQWRVAGQRHGDVRNYAYSVQWYVFVAFAGWFWLKVVRDARRRGSAADPTPPGPSPTGSDEPAGPGKAALTSTPPYRVYAMPQAAAITVTDPEMARYNAYLHSLAEPASPSATAQDAATGAVRREGTP